MNHQWLLAPCLSLCIRWLLVCACSAAHAKKIYIVFLYQVSGVRCCVLGVRCQVLGVRCRMLPVRCRVSPVICHYRQLPQPWTLPLLTPPVCTAGWCCCFSPRPINNVFFLALRFSTISEPNLLNLRTMSFHCFSKRNLFCNSLIWLSTIVNGHNKEFFKNGTREEKKH